MGDCLSLIASEDDNTMSPQVPPEGGPPEGGMDGSLHRNPAAILAATRVAKTLTISDQHANILLHTMPNEYESKGDVMDNDKQSSEQKALLKLTLVPFHKTELACLPMNTASAEEAEKILSEEELAARAKAREQEEQDHSLRVLSFLSRFEWRMTSESGAEYSFHEAFLRSKAKDDEGSEPAAKRAKQQAESSALSALKAELIYPASERQVSRAMPSPGMSMVYETRSMYECITKPFIKRIVDSGSLSWLKNIVEVKKEKERLLHNGDGWILNVDTKWRSHPNTFTVPRSEWYKHESVNDLYCLGIMKEDGVATLRDLRANHLPLLRDMLDQGPKIIEKVYGVKSDQLRVFVHYQPQFYHFHVHFTRLENDIGAQAEKAHLLSDIIQDLEKDSEYFLTRTMAYKLSLKDDLYKLLSASDPSSRAES